MFYYFVFIELASEKELKEIPLPFSVNKKIIIIVLQV